MSRLLSPPVPQNLREMLEGYPEHVGRIREMSHPVPARSLPALDRAHRAIWSLKAERRLHRSCRWRYAAMKPAKLKQFSRDSARSNIPMLSDLQAHRASGLSNGCTSPNVVEGLFRSRDTIHVRFNAPTRLLDSASEPLQQQDFYAVINGSGRGETIGRRGGKS